MYRIVRKQANFWLQFHSILSVLSDQSLKNTAGNDSLYSSYSFSLKLQSQPDISPWGICPLASESSEPLSTFSPGLQKSLSVTAGYLNSNQVGSLIFFRLRSDIHNSCRSTRDGHDSSQDSTFNHPLIKVWGFLSQESQQYNTFIWSPISWMRYFKINYF